MKKLLASLAILCCALQNAAAVDLKVNGFFNAGYAQSDSSAKYYTNIDNRGTYQADSSLGLQVAGKIDEKLSFTIQAVAESRLNGPAAQIDWAYVSYAYSDDLQLRAGRIRIPTFFWSDSIKVRYAQPWVRPPQEVYSLGNSVDSLDGADALYRANVGNVDLTIQPYLFSGDRTQDSAFGTLEIDARRGAGLVLAGSVSDFTLRAGYLQVDSTVSLGGIPLPLPPKTTISNAGFMYDKSLLVLAEYARRSSEGSADTNGWYTTLGYHFGKYLPHVTVAKLDEPANILAPSAIKQKSTTVGLRYELGKSSALKFEWEKAKPLDGTPGLFATTPAESAVNIYSVAIATSF